jgi:ribosomal protein L33
VLTVDETSKKANERVEVDPYRSINFIKPQKSSENTIQAQFDEVKKLEKQLAMDKVLNDDIIQPTVLLMCKQIAQEVMTTYKNKVDTVQKLEIKKSSDNYLIEGFMLDHFLKSMSTHGRYMSNDDEVNKLIDIMMMDVLLLTQNDVRKIKYKTLQNYPLKKFHINSFINVVSILKLK